jgi:hypothetical protein
MNKDDTISIQEVRKNPIGFLRQINSGKTLTVIYRSQPFATVTSGDVQVHEETKSTNRLLAYAELARTSAKATIDASKSYKQIYAEDMAKKYGIS